MILRLLLAGLLLSIGLSFVHPFGNPRAKQGAGKGALLEHAAIPAAARDVLRQKCADCHSNETVWPAYGRLAPASWLMERDITRAREQMNLSQWDLLPETKQETLKSKIVQQARTDKMPPLQYRLMHRNAAVTEQDVKELTAWARGGAENAYGDAGVGEAARGATVFQARCTGCHTLDKNREGPHLGGVFGRISGTVADFDYSDALKKAAVKWDEESLKRWLTDPDALVRGNNMEFHVAKAQERADLVAYLKSAK